MVQKHKARGVLGFLTGKLPLENETTLFILVSALDVFMTWILLQSGNFVESNPVARYFLHHWGKHGFVGFKFGMVALICLIAQIVAIYKPGRAKFILNLGTIVVTFVVCYSLMLYLRNAGPGPELLP
ncbi:MAG: hypothetical protein KDA78_04835 [Planctomycetaceae bacterium]|nr:hypothetical protein [Planctomycetaceae bacterium]